jgi:hypothetical protein
MTESCGPEVDPSQNGKQQDVLDRRGWLPVPPTLGDHVVEAPVMGLVVFLVGLATTLTGAFIRSCESVPLELFQSWCGGAPQSLALAVHQHCAGCVLMAAGLGLIAVSPMLLRWTTGRTVRAASR